MFQILKQPKNLSEQRLNSDPIVKRVPRSITEAGHIRRTSLKVPSGWGIVATGLCMVVSMILMVISSQQDGFVFGFGLALLGLGIGYRYPDRFLPVLFFLMPLMGCMSMVLDIGVIPVLLPFLYSGGCGNFLRNAIRKEGEAVLYLPSWVWVYTAGLILSSVVAVTWSGFTSTTQSSMFVAQTPWASIKLINAFGWTSYSLMIYAAGIMVYSWFINASDIGLLRQRSLKALFFGMLIAAGMGIGQTYGWLLIPNPTDVGLTGVPQFNASFTHPNSLGLSAAMLFPVWIGSLKNINKWYVWLTGPSLIFMLFIANSRAAFLIVFLAVVIIGIDLLKRKAFSTETAAVILIFILAFLWMGSGNRTHVWGGPSRFKMLLSRVDDALRDRAPLTNVLGDRKPLWKAGTVTFLENPVLGVGLGMYLIRMPSYAKSIGKIFNDNSGNMYLHVAAEQGAIGLFSFLFLLMCSVFAFVRRQWKTANPIQVAAFASYLGLCVAFLFGAHLLLFEVNLLFWLFSAISHT